MCNHCFARITRPPAWLAGTGNSEKEQRAILEEKYGDKIKASRQGRENMQKFFDQVKSGDEATNEKLNHIMLKGRGAQERTRINDPSHIESLAASSSKAAEVPRVPKKELASTRIETR